jgi:hypothetical protein
MVGNTTDAEDQTQEAFLLLFRKIHTFRGDSAFSSWLHRLAVNTVLMHLRKKSLPAISIDEGPGADEMASGPDQPERSLGDEKRTPTETRKSTVHRVRGDSIGTMSTPLRLPQPNDGHPGTDCLRCKLSETIRSLGGASATNSSRVGQYAGLQALTTSSLQDRGFVR